MLEFKNKQQLIGYTSRMKKRLQDGEVVFLEKEKKNFIWKDNGWIEMKTEGNSNIQMTMYEINKQIVSQLPPHKENELEKDKDIINEFYKLKQSEFYMLLCKEQSYYTVLRRNNAPERLGPTVVELLIEIEHSILSIENINNNEIEIWSKDKKGEIWCSHLFSYDLGVVDFGG